MRHRTAFLATCALVFLVQISFAQESVTVRIPGADRPGVITSNSLAVIEGIPIDVTASSPVTGQFELAGYRVEVDSRPCRLTHVGPEAVVFLVAEGVRPSEPARWTRTLLIQGPTVSRFIDVIVERFYPIVVSQGGFAVATAGLIAPALYIGDPIPVDRSPYILIRTTGILTGQLPIDYPAKPVIVLSLENERIELSATCYPVAGWASGEHLAFTGPSHLNGEYQLHVEFAGYVSNRTRIRFVSHQSQPITIERGFVPRGTR